MKKNVLIVLMCLVIMMGVIVSQAYTAEPGSSSGKAAPAAAKTPAVSPSPAVTKTPAPSPLPAVSKMTGKVTACNLKNQTVTISDGAGKSVLVSVDRNSTLTKAGKNIKLTDIKNGDTVNLKYDTKNGINLARVITVQEKKVSTAPVQKAKK
ncbi:MAG: hypothetical protein KJ893_03285 [Candidatus Omnitrophica bacterium]|nr:hypothetical protein [Candidatus Omnitrophota bacterium]